MDAKKQKLFAIINPVAGSCDAETVKYELAQACIAAGRDFDCYFTSADEDDNDIINVAQKALNNGCGRIVVAGGDGTVAAVGSALIGSDYQLAILPVGTANLLARELGIPFDLPVACQLAASGENHRQLDAMRVGERVFLSHISLGVYSKIAERTSRTAKRYFRQVAYVWNALPELLSGHTWRFSMQVDEQEINVRASFIMVANVGELGAADLRWGEDISLDDGTIDICVVHARTLKDYLTLAWCVLRRRHVSSPKLSYYRATQRVRVATKHKQVPVRGDGEIIGYSFVEITLLPHAVKVITPLEPTKEYLRSN